MRNTILENAYAVLLPAFSTTQLSNSVRNFLDNGGCSILLGETRDEYVNREMSIERKRDESAETLSTVVKEAQSLADNIIVAVDQEISGICRLHSLAPSFPSLEELAVITNDDFKQLSRNIAISAKTLGINCFLGPILDVVTGVNPWLQGRTWSTDPEKIARLSSIYIHTLQENGIAATAKHFPGYSEIHLDPAIEHDAKNSMSKTSLDACLIPFKAAIDSGVEIIMTGPAIVEVIDPIHPASLSPDVIGMLRNSLNFSGIVMSDDLDAKTTLRGNPLPQVAVEALKAGSDLLLIGDIDDQIFQVAQAIIDAVDSCNLPESRLNDAATKVRSVAVKYRNTLC